MVLLAGTIILAIISGYAVGGRLRRIESLSLKAWPLALIGLGLQFIPLPFGPSRSLGAVILLISLAAIMAFSVINIRVSGMPLVLAGLLLNTLVIGVNEGMPVTKDALVRSGQSDLLRYLIKHGGAKHHLATHNDGLLFLADSIPAPPPVRQVVSIGDILVYAGVVWIIVAAMRKRPEATGKAPQLGTGTDHAEDPLNPQPP